MLAPWTAGSLMAKLGMNKKFAVSVTRSFGKLFFKNEQIVQALNRLSGTLEYWQFGNND
jgi:hypothetical protein